MYFDVSQLEEPTVIRKSRIGVSAEEIARNFEKACSNIAKGLGVSKTEKAEEADICRCGDQNCSRDEKPEIGMATREWKEYHFAEGQRGFVEVGKFGNVYCDRETKESENMKPTNPKDIAGSSKVPMNSMLSGAVMGEVALALFEGALKYGRHNYRQDGVRASVYYDAVGRHLSAWWEGEDVDEESGLSHITKAMAGLHILRDCSIRGMCNDDRPPKTADFMRELNNKTKALIEKYPNPVPPVLEKEQGECIPEDTTSEGVPYLENTDSETYYTDGSRSFTRKFKASEGDNTEFEWHRDHYDRRVRAVINGGGWFIQFEGEKPVELTKDFITIKKGQEHRLLFVQGAQEIPFDLIVEIFEYPDGLPEQSGCCGTGGCC